MTDANNGAPEPTDEEIEESYRLPADGHLQFLVQLVNNADIEFGLTVTVGGLIVSGRLASLSNYFKDFSDAFADGLDFEEPSGDDSEARESIREMMALPARVAKKSSKSRELAPRHLHLRNPSFRSGQAVITPNSPMGSSWWRGRLSEIDGYFLGEIDHE